MPTRKKTKTPKPKGATLKIEELGLDELQSLQRRVERQTAMKQAESLERLRTEYDAVMAKIERALKPYGLTSHAFINASKKDVADFLLARAEGTGASEGKSKSRRGKGRGLVPPQFRHPTDPSKTWTGRGNRPRWLRDWLEEDESHDMQDLRI